jgi:hypothetical protein
MKQLIAISVMTLALTTCASPSTGATIEASEVAITQVKEPATFLQRVAAEKAILVRNSHLLGNTKKVNKIIRKLKVHVGKTWYVFSGATPQGWDCSGLTMWAYEQLGIKLEHRASKQQHAGFRVSTPKIGDIVTFTYKGYGSAYHVGIYLSTDKMLHAGGKTGQKTSITSISKFAGKNSKVSYRRILKTA